MKDFNKILNEELDALPAIQGLPMEDQGKLDLIQELHREIESARSRVSELELDLRHAMEEYNIELAKALRKKLPQVGVNLSNGKCSASYKSTSLSCRPDLITKTWVFDPNQHGRRFTRNNGGSLNLHNSIDPLVDAMVQYFSRYKSLR